MRILKEVPWAILGLLVVLMGPPTVSGADTVLFDDFTTFSGWTYDPANCPGFTVASDGDLLYVVSYGSCPPGGDQWEGVVQTLPEPITPYQNFEVAFHPVVLTDLPSQMGGVMVECLNDAGEVVARVNWFEPQAGTGYGGLTFWAEGNLIYGNLTGFDTEYGTINNTVKLRRTGNTWSAWVDDEQKGSDLTLAPTMTITKIWVSFYNFVNWPEREIKVDFVSLTSSGPGWCDDFESYAVGTHPSTWHGTGNSSATRIDNTVAYTGNNSLRFYGLLGGCWAGLASHPLEISYPFTLEMAVRNGSEPLSGCHPYRASLEFKTGPNWWDQGVPGGFWFLPNGDFKVNLNSTDPSFSGFALNAWHKVRVEYDTPGDGLLHAKYWVDEQYLGEYTRSIDPGGFNPQYIMIGAQEGSAWFDDVCVSPLTAVSVNLDIKPCSCPNPLNVKAPKVDVWVEADETPIALKSRPDRPQEAKAVLPVAILGTADFDITDIDPATVMLEGVPALRWNIEDVSTPVGEEAEELYCSPLVKPFLRESCS